MVPQAYGSSDLHPDRFKSQLLQVYQKHGTRGYYKSQVLLLYTYVNII